MRRSAHTGHTASPSRMSFRHALFLPATLTTELLSRLGHATAELPSNKRPEEAPHPLSGLRHPKPETPQCCRGDSKSETAEMAASRLADRARRISAPLLPAIRGIRSWPLSQTAVELIPAHTDTGTIYGPLNGASNDRAPSPKSFQAA